MGDGRWARGGLAGAALIGALLGVPAGAEEGGFQIFTSRTGRTAGTGIATGGDGTVVLYSGFSSHTPPEDPITSEALEERPYLGHNMDLFSWQPGSDGVSQFTSTAHVEDEDATMYIQFTANHDPVVESRSFVNPDGSITRFQAAAFVSNADQSIVGPFAAPGDVEERLLALGNSGRTIYVWNSEDERFVNILDPYAHGFEELAEPSMAVRSTVLRSRGIIEGFSVDEVFVAFSGEGDLANDNADGDREIFLWSRRASNGPDDVPPDTIFGNGGLSQITHTDGYDCWSPAVNETGQVAFLSDADLTGQNPTNETALFLWTNGRLTQVAVAGAGETIESPRWASRARRLYFSSTGDFVEKAGDTLNDDNNSEIFYYDAKARKIRQVTRTDDGDSWNPAPSSNGQRLAFLSDATFPAGSPATTADDIDPTDPEILVLSGKRIQRVTTTTDGGDNGAPFLTRGLDGEYDVTFVSSSNLDGRNSEGNERIYRARVR